MKIFALACSFLICHAALSQSEKDMPADRVVTVVSREGNKADIRFYCLPEKIKLQQPILLIDDEPVALTAIHLVDIKDIDRVEVIQGAEATAKYGNKAKGGVIRICLKASAIKRAYI